MTVVANVTKYNKTIFNLFLAYAICPEAYVVRSQARWRCYTKNMHILFEAIRVDRELPLPRILTFKYHDFLFRLSYSKLLK